VRTFSRKTWITRSSRVMTEEKDGRLRYGYAEACPSPLKLRRGKQGLVMPEKKILPAPLLAFPSLPHPQKSWVSSLFLWGNTLIFPHIR
ncbi:MAG: hypothetical protein ACLFNV_13525, partial [Desulfovibrionales bacterium]